MPVKSAARPPVIPAHALRSAQSLPNNGDRPLVKLDTPTAGAVFPLPAPAVTVNERNPLKTLRPVMLQDDVPEAKIRPPPHAPAPLPPSPITNFNPERLA